VRRRQRPSFGPTPAKSSVILLPHGRLVTSILAVIGEFERELIRSRTDEGRKRAQARGVRFGRKPKLSRYQIEEAIARREAGETLIDIRRSYSVSHSTISRLASDEGVGRPTWPITNRPSCCYRPNSLQCVKLMASHRVRS
jgi:DNA invertase Pin-like site-specific DNA recombinase